ncbi:MAG: helix-turn-helix domain-containing protein [Acidobacteria bacterium]|nr:helix-turn-helix domain-containing protein [Acidobacteriota bacterium]
MSRVDNIAIRTDLDPYLSLKALSAYSGMSVRSLRKVLADSAHPLPYYRVGGKTLVRRSEFDSWMARHRREGSDLDRLTSKVLEELQR